MGYVVCRWGNDHLRGKGADGKEEAIPARDDNTRGYRNLPLMDQTAKPEEQYEVVATKGSNTFYRVIPKTFQSDSVITRGKEKGVKAGDVHKYTVVLWLEGDDPDCVDALIGGHLGVEMNYRFLDSEDGSEMKENSLKERWDSIWDSLIFWEG